MKCIKVSNLLLVFVLILATSLQAQQQNKVPVTPEDSSAQLTEWMKINLKLSDEQVLKAEEINLKYANKNQTMQNNSQSKKQKKKSLKENEEARDTELKTVMTEEQFKTYESKKAEMKKEMKAEGGGGVKNGKTN